MPALRFRDHAEFHRQVVRATGACAALGGALAAWDVLSVRTVPTSLVWAVGAAAILWALVPPRSLRQGLQAGLAIALGIAVALLAARRDRFLAAALGGAALGLYAGVQRERLWRTAAVVALAAALPLGMTVASALLDLGVGGFLHPVVGQGLVGAVFGFVTGTIGALGRQIELASDKVEEAYEAAKPHLRGELAELVAHSLETRRRILTALASRPEGSGQPAACIEQAGTLVDEVTRKVIAVAARFGDLDREAEADSASALCARIEALGKKIDETSDEVARTHYRTAREALRAQLGHVREISLSRQRAMARLASYQATLDQLRLAAVQHRSADTERFAAELRPIMDQLASAGRELEYDAHGIGESTAATDTASEPSPAAEPPAPANVVRFKG